MREPFKLLPMLIRNSTITLTIIIHSNYLHFIVDLLLIVVVFPVNGGWSEWEDESECSATCGGGMISKSRTCTNPSPSCGGNDCEGDNFTSTPCNVHCCPGLSARYVYLRFNYY